MMISPTHDSTASPTAVPTTALGAIAAAAATAATAAALAVATSTSDNKSKKNQAATTTTEVPLSALPEQTRVVISDFLTSPPPRHHHHQVLVAIDSRFQRCVAVFLPHTTARNLQLLRVPAALASPSIRFLQLPCALFVGLPPRSALSAAAADADGMSSDFTVQEPSRLPVALTSHGVTPRPWSIRVGYFLRFPSASLVETEMTQKRVTTTAAASPSSFALLRSLIASTFGGGGGSKNSLVSSVLTSFGVSSNFFAPAPSSHVHLTPEQELERYLALNSSTSSLVQQPPQVKMSRCVASVVNESINEWFRENASVLSLSTATTTKSLLEVRRVVAGFAEDVKMKVLEKLPERLFRESGVRVFEVAVMRE